jgi:hypothetical protein
MADAIKAGTVFVREGVLLPESARFEGAPYSDAWKTVTDLDGYGLDRKIREAGWTFFYMAGEITASVFGFDREKTLGRAVSQVLAKIKSEKCNCLEITQVVPRHFLGLPYVTLFAHRRHIQEGNFLFHPERHAKQDRAKPVAASA